MKPAAVKSLSKANASVILSRRIAASRPARRCNQGCVSRPQGWISAPVGALPPQLHRFVMSTVFVDPEGNPEGVVGEPHRPSA